jgi:hypothetical protein
MKKKRKEKRRTAFKKQINRSICLSHDFFEKKEFPLLTLIPVFEHFNFSADVQIDS